MNKKPAKKLAPNQFKKGNKAAVGHGRPPMSPEQKALALTTRTQFKNLLCQYMTLTKKEITALLKTDLPVIDIAVLRHLKEMHTTGSMDRIDWTSDHVMGKPQQTTNINLNNGASDTNLVDLKKLPKEKLVALSAILGDLENGDKK